MALPSLRQGEETVDNSARRACVRVLAARAPYAPAWRAGRPRQARYACRYTGGQVRAVRRSPPSCGVRGLCSLSLPLSLSLSLSPSPSLCQSDPPSPPAPRPSPCSGTSPRRLSHLIQWPIRPAAGSGAAAPRRRCWSAGRRSPRGGGGSWRTCRAVRAGARERARAHCVAVWPRIPWSRAIRCWFGSCWFGSLAARDSLRRLPASARRSVSGAACREARAECTRGGVCTGVQCARAPARASVFARARACVDWGCRATRERRSGSGRPGWRGWLSGRVLRG